MDHPPTSAPPSSGGDHPDEPTLGSALGNYASARAELFTLEAKEAAEVVGKKAGAFGAATAALIVGYFFFLLGLSAVIGTALEPALKGDFFTRLGGWPIGAAIIALIHLLAGFILIKIGSRGEPANLFAFTRDEFKKDHAWTNRLK